MRFRQTHLLLSIIGADTKSEMTFLQSASRSLLPPIP